MKKYLAMALSAIMLLGALAGCSSKPESKKAEAGSEAADTSASSPKSESAAENLQNVFKKDPKDIGIVLIVNNNLGDKSFCDLSNEGLLKIAEDYGCRVKVVELNGDQTKQVPTMIEFAEDPDWDIIAGATYNTLESMQTVAQEFPDQMFILYDARDPMELPNIYCVEHLQNEGAFLAGAGAAMLTSTEKEWTNSEKTIGFIAGMENTAIDDFLVGYIQGAKYVDPEIKVLISYIGDFKDAARAKELAIAQINQGADVIFGVAGGAGLGVMEACKEKNVYAIGVDSDQAIALEDKYPEISKHIATSMMKRVDKTIYNAASAALEGTITWGTYEAAGLAQGTVGLAKNSYYEEAFTEEQRAKIDEIEKKVADGEIKVETAVGISNERLEEIKSSAS